MKLKVEQPIHLIAAGIFFAAAAVSLFWGSWVGFLLGLLFGAEALVYRKRTRQLHELQTENARLRKQLAAAHASLN